MTDNMHISQYNDVLACCLAYFVFMSSVGDLSEQVAAKIIKKCTKRKMAF